MSTIPQTESPAGGKMRLAMLAEGVPVVKFDNESPAQRDARFAFERARKRRDNLCYLHREFDKIGIDCRRVGESGIENYTDLAKVAIEERLRYEGVEDPTEEVCAYIDEKPVCRICALSDVNCKCSRDDVRLDSSALAERG